MLRRISCDVNVLILGCGFTGKRVKHLLSKRGITPICTNRSTSLEQAAGSITRETIVLHSVPVPIAASLFPQRPPARIVYLSTTGVYGATPFVDEHTETAPRTTRELARIAEERVVSSGPWTSLILRPAAIYGPGRGIHASMREGTYQLFGDGSNFVSRIHVDDLAFHAETALFSELTGTFPVADEEPSTSQEIAAWCAELLGIPMPLSVTPDQLGETRRADRRVDGSAIRRLLNLKLKYPNYREGIPACLVEEARALSIS
jgi:nucleoside-diphosphate-sugar epimerase